MPNKKDYRKGKDGKSSSKEKAGDENKLLLMHK